MGWQIIEVPLDDQHTVLVEVSDTDYAEMGDVLVPAANPAKLAAQAGKSVQSALKEVIEPAIETIAGRLIHGVHPPDSVELELGLKILAKVGVVFSAAEADAHITVRMKWQRAQLEPAGPQPEPAAPQSDPDEVQQ